MTLEQSDLPTVTVVTSAFEGLASAQAAGLGIANLRLFVIPHPIAPLAPSQARQLAAEHFPRLLEIVRSSRSTGELSRRARGEPPTSAANGHLFEADGEPEAIQELFDARGWGDGLPIVPPTEERVDAMIRSSAAGGDDLIARLAPGFGDATIRALAVNSVMAGCKPAYFPVIIAATKAMADPLFNLQALQTTTNPVAPLLIVNGPIVKELGLNCGAGVLGPGWRANATIGRAVRLILLNIGGGRPGEADMATHGQPGKYTFCIAENEASNPWSSYAVERGYAKSDNVVSVVNASGAHNISDASSTTPEAWLTTISDAMSALGTINSLKAGDPMLILPPEAAAHFAQQGLSKADLQAQLYERTKIPIERFSPDVVELYLRYRRANWDDIARTGAVPIADSPSSIGIIVAGGSGRHSVFIPTFVNGRTVSIRI